MDVTIRRAGIDDLEIVQKLGAELAESEHKNWDKDLDPKWALSEAGAQAYRKMIENSYVAIAFQKDEPVGYLIGVGQGGNRGVQCPALVHADARGRKADGCYRHY